MYERPPVARGLTVRVPADYPTIQDGIDHTAYADTVLVADGVYTGPGNRAMTFHGRPVTLRSESLNPTRCIIDCEDMDRAFTIASVMPQTVIEGLSLARGYAPGEGGGAIRFTGTGPILRDCRFIANRAAYGGAVSSCAYTITISGCRFESNVALAGPSDYCGFGGLGSAVYVGPGGQLAAEDCTFLSNGSTNSSGACCVQGTADVTRCSFVENDGGGLVRTWDGNLQATSCLFRGNRSFALIDDRGVHLTSCVFVDNEGEEGYGCLTVGWLHMDHCIVAFNAASITCINSAGSVACCDLFGRRSPRGKARLSPP